MPTEYTGTLSHQVIVPADEAGRPGYRVTTAGRSSVTRRYDGHGIVTDFMTKTGPNSHLVGVCFGDYDDFPSLEARAEAAVAEVTVTHAERGIRCIVGPTPASGLVGGERALTHTLELTRGTKAGTTVTEWLFDHDRWRFTVGLVLSPLDGDEARQLALSTLDSWTWLAPSR